MIRFLCLLLLCFCLAGNAAAQPEQPAQSPAPGSAPPAQPTPPTAATPRGQSAQPGPPSRTQAQAALDMLRDDAKRAQLIAVLEAIARAAPLVGSAPAPDQSPVVIPEPAAPPAAAEGEAKPATADEAKLPIPLAPDSVGAQIITGASAQLSQLSSDLVENAQSVADFPSLGRWLVQFATNPDRQQQAFDTGWRLLVALAAGLLTAFALRMALRRPMRALERAAPGGRATSAAPGATDEAGLTDSEPVHADALRRKSHALLAIRRLPYAIGHFLLEVLPALALLAVGYALAGTGLAGTYTTRLVIILSLQAFVACRLAITTMRLLVAPGVPGLRLVHISDEGAAYLVRWTARLAVLIAFSYAAAEIGLLFGLYRVAYDAFLKLVSMVALVCLIIIVLQCRSAVAARIHAPPGRTGRLAQVRNRLALIWPVAAILYLIALWVVWAFEVPNGFSRLLAVVASIIVVAVAARVLAVLAYGVLDRTVRLSPETVARHPGLQARLHAYHPIAHAVVTGAVITLAVLVLCQAWGFDAVSWFTGRALGTRIAGSLGTIGTTLVLALLVWETANAAVQRHLARLAREAQLARSARLRTLLPMLRTTLLISICVIAGLVVLSEIGVNIAPLLAGAGVVGLAIGFGSQKLVQDIITGLFLLLENTMQVGDVVSLGGLSGTVEALSIRTIRLRALDGSVHMVPFSAVTTVTNMTRDFGYAVVDVSVGLNEDTERVADIVRAVAKDMRREPRWDSAIRDDIDVMGVEKFLDTALVLRARIKTVPGQRWAVMRELNQRIKARFDELAIESPWTSYRVLSTTPPPVNTPEAEMAALSGGG